MAEGLILEFDGIGRAEYDAVNAALGLDMASGGGEWPQGMRFHAGGAKEGGWVVFEVWDSREAQAEFMHARLARALAEGGITSPPARAEWVELAASHNL